jgi:FkbM family methyltransferase
MKIFVKRILQGVLGFENYLYVFARYIIANLHRNRKEGDFMHFLKLLHNGDTVLDIGANIGVMTVHVSKKLPASKIIAFEPIPCNIRTFKRVVKHFNLKNVTLIEKALGNTSGQIEMVLPTEKKVRLHGLSHVMHDSITGYNEGVRFSVPLVTLDGMSEWTQLPRIGGIKMDVENYEFFVLDGGKELLKKHLPIVYTELWDNENRQQCVELMTQLGYQTKVLEQGALTDFRADRHKHQNFFFIPIPI